MYVPLDAHPRARDVSVSAATYLATFLLPRATPARRARVRGAHVPRVSHWRGASMRSSVSATRASAARDETRVRDGGDARELAAPPSAEELGSEVSLEQCERLFSCLHFDACLDMSRRVYVAYVVDERAPRPLVRGAIDVWGWEGDWDAFGRSESDDDLSEDETTTRATRAAARRIRRPDAYVQEILAAGVGKGDVDRGSGASAGSGGGGTDADADALAAERAARDAPWIASCLWVQCKFKSASGLGRTLEEDYEELAADVPEEKRTPLGPTARMLWCKLKWEEGPAKHAGSSEEAEIERVIKDLFDEARRTKVLEDESVHEERREAWREALSNLGWLYASQILASQRGDQDAADEWLDANDCLIDLDSMSEIRCWVRDVNKNVHYRFSYYYDETGREVCRRERIEDGADEQEPAARKAATTDTSSEPSSPSKRRVAFDDHVASASTESAPPRSTLGYVSDVVGDVVRDPFGDAALRAYATAAVGFYAAWTLTRSLRATIRK